MFTFTILMYLTISVLIGVDQRTYVKRLEKNDPLANDIPFWKLEQFVSPATLLFFPSLLLVVTC